MENVPRVTGERTHLNPIFGKYAPEVARYTETTEIVNELDAVLAAGNRVPQRTEKVYSLWRRAGDRHAEKGQDVIAAASAVEIGNARIEARNRLYGFAAGVATTAAIAVSAWVVFG